MVRNSIQGLNINRKIVETGNDDLGKLQFAPHVFSVM
jgi:hypothetical protein